MIKANKVGGSFALVAEALGFSTGNHPYRDMPTPNTGLIVVPDLDASYADDLCVCFRELLPDYMLARNCSYSMANGYKSGGRRGLTLHNGSRILFRSSWQAPRALAGIKVDWLGINEPPVRSLWGEILRSVFQSQGPVLMQFTSVQDPDKPSQDLTWLRKEIEDPEKGWSRHEVPLSYENAPHRSKASIDAQMRDCAEWEYDQRILAKWDAPATDRAFDGFDGPVDDDPRGDYPVGMCWDHGEGPGKEVCHLYQYWTNDRGERCAHIFDSYVSPGRTTEAMDARKVAEMLDRWGVSPFEIERACGDTNSAGKSRLTTVNRTLEYAFADLYKLPHHAPPFRIVPAKKGAGSVSYGCRVLNAAFIQGRLTVHKRCAPLVRALRYYKGGKAGRDAEHSDKTDAARYGLTDWLEPTRVNRAAEIRVG